MKEEPGIPKWWQTVPGLLTATAAVITALTGLIVALNQVGLFDRRSAQAPPAQSDTAAPADTNSPSKEPVAVPAAAPPPASAQAIQMPDGRSVTMTFLDAKFEYTVLSARRESIPPDRALLRLRVRAWTNTARGLNFWSDSFRLHAGEMHLKPINDLNEVVSRDETKDADVEFEIDGAIKEAILVIQVGGLDFSGNTRQLRLVFP